ncbi:LysR family transcriptional regulator [Exiguobacterium flavidum]|uniref:LysR family transcriptional regulator n=1 Tax=Exiguobacterium flavidum TaxID=2184695 RepID=UPI0018E502A2|nr:LysR family transcriptional regulator [Exiguobacterium flavidum]
MRLEELQTFITLVDTNHFTEAAEKLHISQPTVSIHLKRLEEDFKTSLIERSTFRRGVHVTPAGKLVYKRAKEMLQLVEQMHQELDLLTEQTRGTLRIGATHTIHEALLGGMLAKFLTAYPDATIDARILNQEQVEEALLDFELDLGMIEGSVSSPHLKTRAFLTDQLVVAGVGEPGDATWILREEGSASREVAEAWLVANDIKPKRVLTAHSNHLVKELVEQGIGVAMLSERLVSDLIKDGRIPVRQADERYRRTFQFVWRDGEPSPLAAKWIDLQT